MRLCLRNDDVALFRQAHGHAAERLARAVKKLACRALIVQVEGLSEILFCRKLNLLAFLPFGLDLVFEQIYSLQQGICVPLHLRGFPA